MRELEAKVRSLINRDQHDFSVENRERAVQKELSVLLELRIDDAGNLFLVRKGAPRDVRLISRLDRVAVDDLYDWKRPRKRQRFLQLQGDANYTGPIMIAEGDSWFEHPLITDLIDLAGREYAILSLARAGDTWSNILDQDSDPAKRYADGTLMGLLHTVKDEDSQPRPPKHVLLSAGGNDLIGQLSRCVFEFDASRPQDAYINHIEFDPLLNQTLDDYQTKTAELTARGKTVFLHCYDYANPQNNGQYIGLPLQRDRHISDQVLMRRILNQMTDCFAEGLKNIAKTSNGYVHFVDLRGTIGTSDFVNGPNQALWSDEMHGNQTGFEHLWSAFNAQIKKHL